MAAAGGAGLGTVCMVADLTEGATPVEAAARASGKTVVFFMLCTSWTALLGPRYRTVRQRG